MSLIEKINEMGIEAHASKAFFISLRKNLLDHLLKDSLREELSLLYMNVS